MSDETIEQSATKKTTLELRNKAVEQYQNAFRAAIEIREDVSSKHSHLLDVQPEAQKSHEAIATLGDIERLNSTDYQRLQKANEDLESAKDAVVKSFDKRGFAFKRLEKVEAAVKAEFEDQKLVNKSEVPIEEKPQKTKKASKLMHENTPQKESSPTSTISISAAEKKEGNKLAPLPANQADVGLEEILISQFATNQDSPLDWVKAQNEKTISNMRHMMVLSFLQEQQFSAEREHFYNEVHKHFGRQIESVGDAEQYIAKLMNSRESDALLRDTAPGAVAATKDYINGIDLDASLDGAGYPLRLVTPEFREKMMITKAYANRIGGEEGGKSFLKALADQKDNFVKGLGDQRVGLAISGSMLAMSVMAGTGPAGLVIGSLKIAQNLLDTEKGKQFQKALYTSSVGFMEKLGVKPEVLEAVTESVKNIWSKSVGSKWGKVAMYGAAACTIVALSPSVPFASENLTTSAHSSAPAPASSLPDITESKSVPQAAPSLPDITESKSAPQVAPSLPDITESKSAPQVTPSAPDINTLDKEPNGFGSGGDITQSVDAPYDIKSGDNLWNIAKEAYGQTHPGQTPNNIQLINMVNEIAEHNHIDNPNMIYSGQTIQIPQNIEPSSELVSGQTDWLKDQSSNMVSRLEGLSDRTQEWRQEHKLDSQASLPKGSIRV